MSAEQQKVIAVPEAHGITRMHTPKRRVDWHLPLEIRTVELHSDDEFLAGISKG